MEEKINKVISFLQSKIDEIKVDYNIVLNSKEKILKNEKYFYHNTDITLNAANVLIKNRFDDFLILPFNIKDLKEITKMQGDMITKLFFNDVNIKNGKIKDSCSYVNLMQRLFAPGQRRSFKKVDKDSKKDNKNGIQYNILEKTKTKFISSMECFLSKNLKIINAYTKLINKLSAVKQSIGNDDDYKKACEDLFSYIKDEHIDLGIIDNLKVDLKNKIKKEEKDNKKIKESKIEKEKLGNNSVKQGTREERIKAHEKEELNKTILRESKALNADANFWVDLLVDQLKEMDLKTTNDFLEDPESYLPDENENNYNQILELTMNKLKYVDADSVVIDTLSNLVRR